MYYSRIPRRLPAAKLDQLYWRGYPSDLKKRDFGSQNNIEFDFIESRRNDICICLVATQFLVKLQLN